MKGIADPFSPAQAPDRSARMFASAIVLLGAAALPLVIARRRRVSTLAVGLGLALVITIPAGIVLTPTGHRLVRAIDPAVTEFQAECDRATTGTHWRSDGLATSGHCKVRFVSSQGVCAVDLGAAGGPAHVSFLSYEDSAAAQRYRATCEGIATPSDLQAARSVADATAVRCYQASFLGDLVACSLDLDDQMRILRRQPDEPAGWNAPLFTGR